MSTTPRNDLYGSKASCVTRLGWRRGNYAAYREAKISRQTRFFCQDGGAALLVARYTIHNRKPYLLNINMYTFSTTVPATGVHSLAFSFVQIKFRRRLVHKSRAMFGYKAISSAQGPLSLLDPKGLSAAAIPSRNATRACLHDIILPFSRLSNSGAVVKSVVMIFMLQSPRCLVRALPCVPPRQLYAFPYLA